MFPSRLPFARRDRFSALLAAAVAVPLLGASAPPPPAAAGGHVFVADRASGTVSVIDVQSDQVVTTLQLPPGPGVPEPMYVVYTPVQRRVFVGDRGNDRVVAFDPQTFAVEGMADAGAGVFHMWGNTATKQLWVNNDVDLTTSVVDMLSFATVATIPTPSDLVALGGKPHDVIVDPDGEHAYVTVNGVQGAQDFVVRFDAQTFQEVDRAAVGDDAHLSLSQANELLFVPCQAANAVYVLDRTDMSQVAVLDVPGAHGAGMTRNGRVFYTTNLPGGGTDALWAIDTQSLQVVGQPADAPYATPHNVALTPNARKLYLTHSGDASDKVAIYAILPPGATPTLVGEVTVGLNPFGLAYAP